MKAVEEAIFEDFKKWQVEKGDGGRSIEDINSFMEAEYGMKIGENCEKPYEFSVLNECLEIPSAGLDLCFVPQCENTECLGNYFLTKCLKSYLEFRYNSHFKNTDFLF